MTHNLDTRTTQLIDQDIGKPFARMEFTNNHRLNKNALIAEIEDALGFSPNKMAPGLA